ncbi:MAG: hypothetical protein ABL973_17050 [Micropepsaceae bacterium]
MTDRQTMARLMQGVIPYVSIPSAARVIEFYKKAFGANEHGEPALHKR